MKRSARSLTGFTIGALDGKLGKVREFYFDDETWEIRYIIVETGNWFTGRKVLISPQALLSADCKHKILYVNLTKEQVKNSPDIDTDKPVSRQQEKKLHEYYSWSHQSGSCFQTGFLGTSGMVMPIPELMDEALKKNENIKKPELKGDQNLRSTKKLKGYKVEAIDSEPGEVEDFIIDVVSWEVKSLVVRDIDLGKKILIPVSWVKEIKWKTSIVSINASENIIKNFLSYDEGETSL